MADGSFFAGLHANIRMPETIMNSGPLPPESTAGYPYTLDGLPNARINYASTLLGDVEPYTYGEPDQLSNQTSYLNIPNRIQKIVPLLKLPESSVFAPSSTFMLSHAVDDGDVAFVIRETVQTSKMLFDQRALDRFYTPSNYHALVNLPTVNYLLTGIQLYIGFLAQNGTPGPLPQDWEVFLDSVLDYNWKNKPVESVIIDIIQNIITPFGVVHGSEKQGGQHEGTLSPVTWACNFISTFYVDGYVRNLCNVWRNTDIRSGSHLMFELVKVPFLSNNKFQLNHYSKATVTKDFHNEFVKFCPIAKHIYILQPTVVYGNNIDRIGWRIALSYVQRKKIGCTYNTATDDRANLNGPLLEAAFGPKFCKGLVSKTLADMKKYTSTHSSHAVPPPPLPTVLPALPTTTPHSSRRTSEASSVSRFPSKQVSPFVVAPMPPTQRHSSLLAATSAPVPVTTNNTPSSLPDAAVAVSSQPAPVQHTELLVDLTQDDAATSGAGASFASERGQAQGRKSRSSAAGGASARKRRDRSEDVSLTAPVPGSLPQQSTVQDTLNQADDLLAQLDTI